MNKTTLLQLIHQRLDTIGVSAAEASRRACGNPYLIRNIEKRGHSPSLENVIAICEVLGISLSIAIDDGINHSTSALMVPHYGRIAAGGSSDPNDDRVFWGKEFWDGATVPAPAEISKEQAKRLEVFAMTVEGDSMHPLYNDGDVVYLYGQDPLRHVHERLIGKVCAVKLSQVDANAAYLKRLRRPDNNKQGFFNLESLNPTFPTMINRMIELALPVRFHKSSL